MLVVCKKKNDPIVISPFYNLCTLSNSSGKFKASNEVVGLPYHASHNSGCQLRGQNCYAEITLGCPISVNEKILHRNSSVQKNFSRHNVNESSSEMKFSQKGLPETSKMFIYPAEAVLVPVMQISFARSSLKR